MVEFVELFILGESIEKGHFVLPGVGGIPCCSLVK